MKLKAAEFLQRKKDELTKNSIILLNGGDLLLREITCEYFGRLTGLWPDAVEKREIQDARNLVGEWSEGSLMGPRFMKVYAPGKMKHPESLMQLLEEDNEDKLVISASEEWTGAAQTKFLEAVCTIDCGEPRNTKERLKLATVRSSHRDLRLSEEVLKAIAERCELVVDIETALITLKLLSHSHERIGLKEVTAVTGEPIQYKDTTRALITGNTVRLSRELLEGDPLPSMGLMTAILIRLYSWLNTPEEDEAEEQAAERLKIQKRHLKDWKQARKKFSPQLIRQTLLDVNQVYQDFRVGNQSDWRERIRLAISKLSAK